MVLWGTKPESRGRRLARPFCWRDQHGWFDAHWKLCQRWKGYSQWKSFGRTRNCSRCIFHKYGKCPDRYAPNRRTCWLTSGIGFLSLFAFKPIPYQKRRWFRTSLGISVLFVDYYYCLFFVDFGYPQCLCGNNECPYPSIRHFFKHWCHTRTDSGVFVAGGS